MLRHVRKKTKAQYSEGLSLHNIWWKCVASYFYADSNRVPHLPSFFYDRFQPCSSSPWTSSFYVHSLLWDVDKKLLPLRVALELVGSHGSNWTLANQLSTRHIARTFARLVLKFKNLHDDISLLKDYTIFYHTSPCSLS